MNYDLNNLRLKIKLMGTAGTPGTADLCRPLVRFQLDTPPGTLGTKIQATARYVSHGPITQKLRAVRIGSVHAGFPTFPSIPTHEWPTITNGQPLDDPMAWEPEVVEWGLQHCVFRDRVHWSIRDLHERFCGWCMDGNAVPCTLPVFEYLLRDQGFSCGCKLVCGLMPKEEEHVLLHRYSNGVITKSDLK